MQLTDKIKFIPRRKIKDSRGWFLKAIDGHEENLPQHTGEIYITVAEPLQAKGGHYHNKAQEWFTLLTGTCTVKLQDVVSGETKEFTLDQDDAQTLYVAPSVAHIFINKSAKESFILLAYTDVLYDPADTIMYKF